LGSFLFFLRVGGRRRGCSPHLIRQVYLSFS
jgi:hypothetical protein